MQNKDKLLAEAAAKVAEMVHEHKVVVHFGARRPGKSMFQRMIRELKSDHWDKDRDA